MPVYETRGIGLIAEAGQSPQTMYKGSISTPSYKENDNSDSISGCLPSDRLRLDSTPCHPINLSSLINRSINCFATFAERIYFILKHIYLIAIPYISGIKIVRFMTLVFSTYSKIPVFCLLSVCLKIYTVPAEKVLIYFCLYATKDHDLHQVIIN